MRPDEYPLTTMSEDRRPASDGEPYSDGPAGSDGEGDPTSRDGERGSASRDSEGGPASHGDEPSVPDRLAEALQRGRVALGATAGAVVRGTTEAWTTVAAVDERGRSGATHVPEDALRRTLRSDGAVVDDANGERFVGCRLAVDDAPVGAVCFTGDGRSGRAVDADRARAAARLVARLVERELDGGAEGVWSQRAFTETLLDTVPGVLYACTPDGTPVQWNDRLEAVTGYGVAEIAGADALSFVAEPDRDRAAAGLSAVDAGETVTEELRLATADGERIPYEFTTTPITDGEEVVGFAGVGRDVTDQREYEATLAELHDTTRELLRAGSEREVCERIVTATSEVVDIAVAGTFLFDEGDNVLRPVAQSEGADAVVGEPPAFGPGEGVAWNVFMRGETAVFDDVRGAEDVYDPETAVRSELLVPVGEHGVLLAGSTAVGAFDDRTVELAEILAANAEAALDNVARRGELAARDAELERQNRRLERLNGINERVRRIGHDLVGADSRDAVEDLVCERLAAVEHFGLVWVGERGPGGDLDVRARAGAGRGYLAAVDGDSTEPVALAARDRERVAVDCVGDDFQSEPWRREALTRDFRSVVALPLDHDRVHHGVLGVYADRAAAFDAETVDVLADLADTVARVASAVERRHARRTGGSVELTVRVAGGTTPLFAVAEALSGLRVDAAVGRDSDRTLLYGSIAQGADAVARAVESVPGVADGRAVSTDGPRTRFELTTDERTLADTVAAFGGELVQTVFDGDAATLVARFPPSADRRSFVTALEATGGSVDVLAQRGRERTDAATDPLSALTDRQREALLAAYHAGFFEWPRESAGEDVAADLSVSQPTFAEHLRRAEAKLLATLVDDRDP